MLIVFFSDNSDFSQRWKFATKKSICLYVFQHLRCAVMHIDANMSHKIEKKIIHLHRHLLRRWRTRKPSCFRIILVPFFFRNFWRHVRKKWTIFEKMQFCLKKTHLPLRFKMVGPPTCATWCAISNFDLPILMFFWKKSNSAHSDPKIINFLVI